MTSPSKTNENNQTDAVPPIVDQNSWEAALAELRVREKAATRELDHWMDDPTGPNPRRAPSTYEHRRAQVRWRSAFAATNQALAAAPHGEGHAHH
jgi:hypothetical protein